MKSLVEEIRTHSIWVVLGVYLAVSWVVLRIVDAISGNLELPGWIFPFALGLLLVGLPIILATWIIQGEVTAGSGTSSPGPEPGSDAAHMRRLFTWKNVLVGGFGGFLALALGTAAWVISGPDSSLPPLDAEDGSVAVGVAAPGGSGSARPALDRAGEAAVQAVRALARAIRSMDVEATLAMYDDRPGFAYAFGSELVRGRVAFDARVRDGFAALRRIDEWEIDDVQTTVIDAENVLVTAHFREVAVDTSGVRMELAGVQTNHLVKRPGGWRISSGHAAAEQISGLDSVASSN